jgi:hypothetical protein
VRWQLWSEHHLMQSRFEAAKALEAETAEWRGRQLALTQAFMESVNRMRTGQVSVNFLSNMTAVESMMGPELLRDGGELQLWKGRIEVAKDLVGQARAAGEPDIQGLLWESSLGFWLINEKPTEARRVLERNRASWAMRAAPGDPWIECLELLHACAIAAEHFARQPATEEGQRRRRPGAAALDPELAAAIRTLQRETIVFRGPLAGGPAHRAVLGTLRMLYGPEYLNEPELEREIAARLREFQR